jgi:long-chain acyl-CoA synthetase
MLIGGENISPSDIEDRLMEHESIGECCVVGLEDHKYGEVVAAFLGQAKSTPTRPSDQAIRDWVSQRLGRIKQPKYIFWVGEPAVGPSIPKTGSGKYQKHLVRALGNKLVREGAVAKL